MAYSYRSAAFPQPKYSKQQYNIVVAGRYRGSIDLDGTLAEKGRFRDKESFLVPTYQTGIAVGTRLINS